MLEMVAGSLRLKLLYLFINDQMFQSVQVNKRHSASTAATTDIALQYRSVFPLFPRHSQKALVFST